MEQKEFVIPESSAVRKISDCLRLFLPGISESMLRRLFTLRDIRLDGARVSRDGPVRAGQVLKVFLPADFQSSAASLPALDVVYEDRDVLLVNKRAGVSVEPDSRGGVSLSELCAAYIASSDPGGFAPAPCHRLDNKTCGLCLFAKTPGALEILQDCFRSRSLEKYYVCLVRGIMKPPAAVCRAYLLKDPKHAVVRITDHPVAGSKEIVTGYETLSSGPVSRLRVHLVTGRTHQIRAHLAALGHPILGDDLYGDRSFNRREKARSLRLCAVSLCLNTGGRLPQLDGRVFSVNPPF